MTNSLTSKALEAALRRNTAMDPTEALRRLQVLVQAQPDFRAVGNDRKHPAETLKWLGELDAVVDAMQRNVDGVALRMATQQLVHAPGSSAGEGQIRAILYRALAAAELAAPASEQGAFVAAGNELDAYAAITKVLASAKQDLLVIDPYMDGKALTDFLAGAGEGVMLRILADEASVKPTLAPAMEKWKAQFGEARPLEVRLAKSRSLHDRLIIVDGGEAWSLTQSLKDFANRAHGSILKADPETSALKIEAYGQSWDGAKAL